MVFRLCMFVATVVAFSKGEAPVAPVVPAARVVQAPVLARISEETLELAPQYSFAYDVQDALTGDSKAHIENRNGDIVQGQYSLNDPDGTRRIVDYTSDPINGFKAIVRKTPLVAAADPVVVEQKPVFAEPLVARTVVSQPLIARTIAAPLVAQAAPLRAAPAAVRTAPAALKTAPSARFEDDSIAVEAFEPVPAAPGVPVAAPAPVAPIPVAGVSPVARVATATTINYQVPYVAAPVLAYSRFSAPLTYAIV